MNIARSQKINDKGASPHDFHEVRTHDLESICAKCSKQIPEIYEWCGSCHSCHEGMEIAKEEY